MVRRIASQVHKQAARLLRADYIQQEPLWYRAVLDFPPIPLPPRAPPSRSSYDLPTKLQGHSSVRSKPPKPTSSEIAYLEDQVRRQFFRDHPFEAYRARTLVENATIEDEHPIREQEWRRLSQRGRNPIPEDCVRFAVSLHQYHAMPLRAAYVLAVMQFRSLRSEHHIATKVAVAEAEAYGSTFGPTETEKRYKKEEEHLATWETPEEAKQYSLEARKRWKAIIDKGGREGAWTRGEEYIRLWKEGVRPDYAPALTAPVEEVSQQIPTDFLDLRSKVEGQRLTVTR